MTCPNGSEPKPGISGYVWIDAAQGLEECRSDTPPWYCYFVGAVASWGEDSQLLCSGPPPAPDSYSFLKDDFGLAKTADRISKLTAYARARGWAKYCTCKVIESEQKICWVADSLPYFGNTDTGPGYSQYFCAVKAEVRPIQASGRPEAVAVFADGINIYGNSYVKYVTIKSGTKEQPIPPAAYPKYLDCSECAVFYSPGTRPDPIPPNSPVYPPDLPPPPPPPVAVYCPPGPPGSPGYTPVKGKDYFDGLDGKNGVDGKDGYTPQKGIDYFDGNAGRDGVNGRDGYTPIKGVDYTDGAKGDRGEPGVAGYTPVKGIDYHDGKDGYTPVKGKDYFDGLPGPAGYTPVKGVDYFDGLPGPPGPKGDDAEVEFLNLSVPITSCNANGKTVRTVAPIQVIGGKNGSESDFALTLFGQLEKLTSNSCPNDNEVLEVQEIIENFSGRAFFERGDLLRARILVTFFPKGLGRRFGYNAPDKFYFGGFAFKYDGFEPERSIDWEHTECLPVKKPHGIEVSLEPFIVANIVLIKEV